MTTQDINELLNRAIEAAHLEAPAVVLAIAVLIATLLVGAAIIIAAMQGKADVKITIDLGRSRSQPP